MLSKFLNYLRHLSKDRSPLLELVAYYFAGRPGGSRRINAVDSVKTTETISPLLAQYHSNVLPTIWDFAARPYALGDILTTLIDWAVYAEKNNKQYIDVYVLADPCRPASHGQGYINQLNFEQYLIELLPAFYFCPKIRNLTVIRDRDDMEKQLLAWNLQKVDSLPSLNQYNEALNEQRPFQGIFNDIKAFHQEYGFVPRFRELAIDNILKDQLLFGFKPHAIFVTVHMRQRQNEGATSHGGALYRDADLDVWLEFLKRAQDDFPQVVFIVVGRVAEFSRQLYALSNVIILKHYGLGLVDELSVIQKSDLFMGGISGPAMFAMFSQTPYLLFQNEASKKEAAQYFCEPVGTQQPFFTSSNQKIIWCDPTTDDLLQQLAIFIKQRENA